MDVVARECRVRDRPLPGARRRGRLLGAHRLRRLPGHAGLRRAPVGRRRRCAAARSASRASARSAATWSSTCSRTAPTWWSPTSASARVRRVADRAPARSTWSPTRTRWSARRPRRLRARARSAARSTTTPCRCCRAQVVCGAANNQLAHPGVEKAARGPRDPLRAGLRGERRRRDPGGRRAPRLRLRPGQGPGDRGSSTPRGGSSRLADDEGVPPAVAADRLAEQRMAEVGRLRGILLPRAGRWPADRGDCATPRAAGVGGRDVVRAARGLSPWGHDDDHTVGAASCRPPRCPARGSSHGARPCQGQAAEGRPRAEVQHARHRPDCLAARAGGEPSTSPASVEDDDGGRRRRVRPRTTGHASRS